MGRDFYLVYKQTATEPAIHYHLGLMSVGHKFLFNLFRVYSLIRSLLYLKSVEALDALNYLLHGEDGEGHSKHIFYMGADGRLKLRRDISNRDKIQKEIKKVPWLLKNKHKMIRSGYSVDVQIAIPPYVLCERVVFKLIKQILSQNELNHITSDNDEDCTMAELKNILVYDVKRYQETNVIEPDPIIPIEDAYIHMKFTIGRISCSASDNYD